MTCLGGVSVAGDPFYKDHWINIEKDRLDRYQRMFQWNPASSALYDKRDPENPINRRISILVMSEQSQAKLKAQQEGRPLPDSNVEELPEDPDFESIEPAKEQEDAFKAFERLRKTMTRKPIQQTPNPAYDDGDEVF